MFHHRCFKHLFSALTLFTPSVFCNCSETPLIVEIGTAETRVPMSLAPFEIEANSLLSKRYLADLEALLRFDIANSGAMVLLKGNSECAAYLLSISVKERSAVAFLQTSEGKKRHFPALSLEGKIESDRKQIHQLADAIHKAVTGVTGIATTHILYTIRKENEWQSELWECDWDGGSPQRLCEGAGYCVTPCYLPPKPGCRAMNLFYVSYRDGLPKIYFSHIGAGTGVRFSPLAGNQLMPAMRKQRDLVAIIADPYGNADLFLQHFSPETGVAGKPFRAYVVGSHAAQASPTFSPDGRQLAFVSNRDGVPRIYILEITDNPADYPKRHAKLISSRCRENSAPAWSPDGAQIAYCAMTDGVRQIWTYDLATQRETQLTTGGEHKENPSWAPNSKVLVYNTNSGDGGELYLVSLSHPSPVKITSGPGKKRFPCWEGR